jgi:hypothetical protein
MSNEDLAVLEKEVAKRKRVVAEWAGRMHDLAEERLPEGFEEIHEIAAGTHQACLAWKAAVNQLNNAKQLISG